MRVLIAYDGSECADAALADLGRAGLPREADATILTVSEIWFPTVHNSLKGASTTATNVEDLQTRSTAVAVAAQSVTETLALACAAQKRLQAHFPSWNIKAEESSGSPAREILKKANQFTPDLIVLGSQGRSGLGRFLLGSVSQKVVNEATCSVRVARGTAWKDGAPVRILLGFESSAGSFAAVDVIAERAWPLASEVRIETVLDSHQPLSNKPNGIGSQNVRSRIEDLMHTAAKKLTDADLTVSCKIEQGDPKQLLIAAAEEWGADCIFIGASCEPQLFGRLLLGTVATAVVARAHCSVEVVRR